MATGQTLSLSIPANLMAEVERVASAEQRSPGEFVQEAVERLLRIKKRERLYAYGDSQAQRLGLSEADVPDIVHQVRSQIEHGQ